MSGGGEEVGARVIDGRAMAQAMLAEVRSELAQLTTDRGSPPEVRVVLVGDDPASAVYARRIVSTAGQGRVPRRGRPPAGADGRVDHPPHA